MRQCLLLLIPANALESGKPGHYNPLAGTGFPKHPVVILFWHPPLLIWQRRRGREEGKLVCNVCSPQKLQSVGDEAGDGDEGVAELSSNSSSEAWHTPNL